jgi:hypothetical protein
MNVEVNDAKPIPLLFRGCCPTESDAGNSPPEIGGVAAALKKGGEAHLSAADGVVSKPKCFVMPDHPVRSVKGGFATSS